MMRKILLGHRGHLFNLLEPDYVSSMNNDTRLIKQ
jgi:hypothetical protein